MTTQVNIRLPQPTIDRLRELAELYGSQTKAVIAAIENLHTKEVEMKGIMEMTYTINYHTGAGNFEFNGDLEGAMVSADEGAAYTQQPIIIEDANGEEVARRDWYGVTPENEGDDIIQFGDYGYYGEWMEV